MAAAAERAPELRGLLRGDAAAAYLPDAGALAAAGLAPGPGLGPEAGFLPPGARSVLLQTLRPLPAGGRAGRPGRNQFFEGLESEPPDARRHSEGDRALLSSAAAKNDEGASSGETFNPELWHRGLLVLAADRPRALSARERLWAAAIAAKLAAVDLSVRS